LKVRFLPRSPPNNSLGTTSNPSLAVLGKAPIFSVTTVGDQFSENRIRMSLRREFRMMIVAALWR